ncbi:MAG TPA: glutamate--tRNA ligase [Acidimicrobiales bacterium]|nr:glutamate--tRNA ligase [Acidimicrobiales bacterium]
MTGGPRVRLAPSPTGYFHVGTARAALYNWLVARGQGGTFILRIEDTDTERGREEWVQGICQALSWLGLDWDEGPYRQSERRHLYDDAARRLAAAGAAYWCACSREEVEARARQRGGPPGYDGWCRDRGLGPGPGRALRFRVPDGGATTVHDVVRGEVVVAHESIDDFVLVKSSGAPLFLLANVVDDADMAISHVIRGEDHLPNTPKYLLLWRALGAGPEPVFAHLPMLVNERRQKLSKRRDPVAVESYREAGYLPDAMVNYLALLGWGPHGDEEVLDRDELVAQFALEDVTHAAAAFDVVKLRHFNGIYLRSLSTEAFIEAAQPFLARGPWPPERYDAKAFARLAPLVQERVEVLGDVPGMVDFVFLPRPERDPDSWERVMAKDPAGARRVLGRAGEVYRSCPWEAPALHEATQALAADEDAKLARIQAPIRVAVTGRRVGPPLFESLEVLGRGPVLERLATARADLGQPGE